MSQQHPRWSAMSNRGSCRRGSGSFGFILCFNRPWTAAVGAVTARYCVSVITRSLIVKWALMKRAGSPCGRLCYWRNGSQQQGQVPSTGTHTHPLWAIGPAENQNTANLWFGCEHMEPGLTGFTMWTFLWGQAAWAVHWNIIITTVPRKKRLNICFLIKSGKQWQISNTESLADFSLLNITSFF